MNEEKIDLMPKETVGVLLKEAETYDIIAVSDGHVARVLVGKKLLPTGEIEHLFTNTNDSPVTIVITRLDS